MTAQSTPYNRLKLLELRFRKWFIQYYRRNKKPTLVTTPHDVVNLPSNGKILVLRQDRIGDVIVSSFILRELRRRFPDAQIDMVLSTNNTSAAWIINKYINTIFTYRKTLAGLIDVIVRIKRQHYDVVVDMMDNSSSTSGILVAKSKARYSIGIQKENAGVYTHCVPLPDKSSIHISRRIANLLMPFGIDPESVDLKPMCPIDEPSQQQAKSALNISDGIGTFRLGVNISGSNDLRSYHVSKTCTVLHHIRTTYPKVEVYVFAAPRHRKQLEEINSHVRGLVMAPIAASFKSFAAMLHEMHALWTPDTSAVHLAAAWNLPCCVMFNQPDLSVMPWFPVGTHCEAIINNGEVLSDIPVEEVITSIDRLFAYCGIEAQ